MQAPPSTLFAGLLGPASAYVCRASRPLRSVAIVSIQKFLMIVLPLITHSLLPVDSSALHRASSPPCHLSLGTPLHSESASAYCPFDSFEFVHLDRAKAIDLNSQHGELHYQVVSIARLHHTTVRVGIVIDSPPLSFPCSRGCYNK